MPSMADSRQEVKEQLASETDHDAILANLQDEIDRHNSSTTPPRDSHSHSSKRRHRTEDAPSEDHERKRKHLRFRFKSGAEPPKRKRHHHRSRKPTPPPSPSQETAHPFPREPVSPKQPYQPSNTHAFQASLFDALADDEAAAYWESVYSQPIHIYPRPSLSHHGGSGGDGVDTMTDDEYAAFVQQRMWERAHPEIVVERELKARKAQEEAEAKEARKRKFVRAREREAWERAGRAKGTRDGEDGEEYEYVFESRTRAETPPPGKRKRVEEDELYARAWPSYLRAWEALTTSLSAPSAPFSSPPDPLPSNLIPWPVLPSKPPTRPHIEAFMRHIPLPTSSVDRAKDRERLLKAERVRWHPDKVQQRFRGGVDEGTMKVVTGVFQVVDGILGEERGRA